MIKTARLPNPIFASGHTFARANLAFSAQHPTRVPLLSRVKPSSVGRL